MDEFAQRAAHGLQSIRLPRHYLKVPIPPPSYARVVQRET